MTIPNEQQAFNLKRAERLGFDEDHLIVAALHWRMSVEQLLNQDELMFDWLCLTALCDEIG